MSGDSLRDNPYVREYGAQDFGELTFDSTSFSAFPSQHPSPRAQIFGTRCQRTVGAQGFPSFVVATLHECFLVVRLLRDLRRVRVAGVVLEARERVRATAGNSKLTLDTHVLHLAHQEHRQQARADDRPHRLSDLWGEWRRGAEERREVTLGVLKARERPTGVGHLWRPRRLMMNAQSGSGHGRQDGCNLGSKAGLHVGVDMCRRRQRSLLDKPHVTCCLVHDMYSHLV